MKKLSKLELACNLTLIGVLAATAIHILILTLNLIGITNFAVPDSFSYIFAYILTMICLGLYILGFFISKWKKIYFPLWLRIMFYAAFFIFTNFYYILGLHTKLWGIVILYAYLAFLICVLSVSVFYNTQKDEKNRLKASNRFITVSVFLYSIALEAFVQFLISFFKVAFFKTAVNSTLLISVVSSATMIIVTIATVTAFYLSLSKTKKFINSCLVKFTVKRMIKKSTKED